MNAPYYVGPNLPVRPNACPHDVVKRLRSLGFEPLGSGCCAFAYGRGERVVKIVCGDTGHRAAVDLFAANPDVIGFPDIYGIVDLADDCFAYEMERLVGGGHSEGFYAFEARAYLDNGEAWDNEWAIEQFIDNFDEETLEILIDGAPVEFMDLHSGNVMARECGQPVIIDPFHSWSSAPEVISALGGTHAEAYRLRN